MVERFGKAVAAGNRCAQAVGKCRRRLVAVGAERLQCSIQRQAGAEQQRELAQQHGDIGGARRLRGQRPAARQHPGRGDLGVDRHVSEILDASQHLGARGRVDFAADDLPGVRDGAIAKLRHPARPQSLRSGKPQPDLSMAKSFQWPIFRVARSSMS